MMNKLSILIIYLEKILLLLTMLSIFMFFFKLNRISHHCSNIAPSPSTTEGIIPLSFNTLSAKALVPAVSWAQTGEGTTPHVL